MHPFLILALLLSAPASAASVLVAARPIPRGTVVTEADVTLAEQPRAPADGLQAPGDAIGRETLRAIARGASIRAGALAAPVAAARGSGMVLRVEGRGFAVEAEGVARLDARVGGVAEAVNATSGRRVRGRVGEDGALVVD